MICTGPEESDGMTTALDGIIFVILDEFELLVPAGA
jgi:hypothetical protein